MFGDIKFFNDAEFIPEFDWSASNIKSSQLEMTKMVTLRNPKTGSKSDECFIKNGFIVGFMLQTLDQNCFISIEAWPYNIDFDFIINVLNIDKSRIYYDRTKNEDRSLQFSDLRRPFSIVFRPFNGIATLQVKYSHLKLWLNGQRKLGLLDTSEVIVNKMLREIRKVRA
jgi:hypothetical protein